MKKYSKWWTLVGTLLGALGGYLYWQEVGCQTGHCPIQSHWQSMLLWGGTMGFLVADLLYQATQTALSWFKTIRKTTS